VPTAKAISAPRTLLAALAVILALVVGCEERVVRNTGPLLGLPNAQSQMREVSDPGDSLLPLVGDDQAMVENPDGTRTARSTSVRQLIANLAKCLENDWGDTFEKDLLSSHAKADMAAQGMTPTMAWARVKREKEQIYRLFNLMPMGEFTPGYFMRRVGDRTFRLRVTGREADQLQYQGIDVVFEKTNYRLYWFYSANP
jgi:hypothetical protein